MCEIPMSIKENFPFSSQYLQIKRGQSYPFLFLKLRKHNICYPDPWITNELLEEIRDKDLALKKARKSGREDHWSFAKNERNRVGRLVELARRDFFHDEERNSRGDPKKFWRNISSCLPSKCSQRASISLIDKARNCQISSNDTPDYINSFFANIGNDLAKDYTHDWSPSNIPNLDSEILPMFILILKRFIIYAKKLVSVNLLQLKCYLLRF